MVYHRSREGHSWTWAHIAPQISKQITAFSNPATEEKVKNICLREIAGNKDFLDLLSDLDISEMEIHGQLNLIFKNQPVIAIPIDEIPTDLTEWAQTIKNDVCIWDIGKYNRGHEILYTLPDEALPSVATTTKGAVSVVSTPMASNYWAEVIEAGLIQEGDELFFNYGPKGKKKTRFTGIARRNGIEVEGVVSSPSVSSLKCIQKISPTRTSSNGWVVWKKSDGKLITELISSLQNQEEEVV